MTRLRTDQACLEAQMQQQIAQNLNAELAVPCPDCGVESGRACRDSLDRAVRTHLARSVAANRRDTEPCPPPPPTGGYWRAGIEQAESLTRASARAFAENLRREIDAAYEQPLFSGSWLPEQTPTASDCAPSPAASAPEADCNGVAPSRGDSGRPDRCANCSQPLGYGTKVLGNVVIGWHCGDCWSSVNLWDPEQSRTLDQRIREAQPDDAAECAWSTPTSDGEGWR